MHRFLMESKYGGVIIASFGAILIAGFLTLVTYLHEARQERQARRMEMLNLSLDILLDSAKHEQERKEKLKEIKANQHPFQEFWDAPYQKGGGD